MPVHVEVVVDALLHAVQRVELGQDDRRQGEVVEQAQAVDGGVGRDERAQLGEDALRRHAGDAGRMGPRRRRGRRLDDEAERRGQPRDPQRTQRVAVEGGGRHHPQAAHREVGQAAVGVDEVAAGQRLGHRVHGQVARGEVLGEGRPLQRDEVHLPPLPHHAPGAVGVREREGRPAGGLRHPSRRRPRVARQREVEVGLRPAAEQPVAHRPADEPRLLVRERRAHRVQRRDGAHAGLPSRTWTRGTRGSRPHTTS